MAELVQLLERGESLISEGQDLVQALNDLITEIRLLDGLQEPPFHGLVSSG